MPNYLEYRYFVNHGYDLRLRHLQDIAKELEIATDGTHQQLYSRIARHLKVKEQGSLDWSRTDEVDNTSLSKLPSEILLKILSSMSLADIKMQCTYSPSFRNLCAEHRNTIAQHVFDSHGFKFDISIRGKQHQLLKQIHAYNDTLAADNWDIFLHKADMDLIRFFRHNIPSSTLITFLKNNFVSIDFLENNEDKYKYIARMFEITVLVLSMSKKGEASTQKLAASLHRRLAEVLSNGKMVKYHAQFRKLLRELEEIGFRRQID